jgi:hypothetical protein
VSGEYHDPWILPDERAALAALGREEPAARHRDGSLMTLLEWDVPLIGLGDDWVTGYPEGLSPGWMRKYQTCPDPHFPDIPRRKLMAPVAAWFARLLGISEGIPEIVLTPTCTLAFIIAAQAAAGVDDEVIVLETSYDSWPVLLRRHGTRVVFARRAAGGQPDPASIAAACTARTKAVVIVSPDNPLGVICPRHVLGQIADLCRERGLTLIADHCLAGLNPYGHDIPLLPQLASRGLSWITVADTGKLFGWWARNPRPGSMRDGNWLVGYGMAGVSFFWLQMPCQARASIRRDGTAFVHSAATDIGTGTYTVMTQLSAELLGLRLDQVRFGLGDTDMPMAPPAGGSGLTAALGNAVQAACRKVIQAFLDTVADDPGSPLRGCRLDDVTVADGRIHRINEPARAEAYSDILARHGLDELTADGDSAPPEPQDVGMAPAGAFAARFVEVRVDPDLGLVQVARVVSAIDGGRILNEKTATSQIIGATVGGIGMALLEETVTDPATGRIANANLGDYLVPVNADVPDLEVLFVGEPDRFNPIGVKGGRRGRPGRHGRRHRQRGLPRHRPAHPLPADHHRPAPMTRESSPRRR